jgi:preprotein translocase SecE subunit
MADDKSSSNKSDKADKPKRRVLRAAPAPTTLREQSEKAQAQADKPRRAGKVGRILAVPFVFIGRLLARIFRPLGKFRFFRFIGYVLVPPYVRNSWKELKQVTWPNRTQTRRLTFAVIIFSLLFGGLIALVDYGLDKAFRALILN